MQANAEFQHCWGLILKQQLIFSRRVIDFNGFFTWTDFPDYQYSFTQFFLTLSLATPDDIYTAS